MRAVPLKHFSGALHESGQVAEIGTLIHPAERAFFFDIETQFVGVVVEIFKSRKSGVRMASRLASFIVSRSRELVPA